MRDAFGVDCLTLVWKLSTYNIQICAFYETMNLEGFKTFTAQNLSTAEACSRSWPTSKPMRIFDLAQNANPDPLTYFIDNSLERLLEYFYY